MLSANPTLETKHAALFRNGRNQALRIPRAFELPGKDVIVYRDGKRLIVEAIKQKAGLLAVLAGLEPLGDEFPDVDSKLMPLVDIHLCPLPCLMISLRTLLER